METNEKESSKSTGQRLTKMMDCLVVVNYKHPSTREVRISEAELQAKRTAYLEMGGTVGSYERHYEYDEAYETRSFVEESTQAGRLTYFKVLNSSHSKESEYAIRLTLNENIEIILSAGANGHFLRWKQLKLRVLLSR